MPTGFKQETLTIKPSKKHEVYTIISITRDLTILTIVETLSEIERDTPEGKSIVGQE